MKIRRAAAAAAAFIIFLFAAVPTRAADVYTFDPDDIDSDSADGEYEKFMEKLPENAADHMDKKDISGYDAKYFVTIAAEALRQAAGPAFGTLAALLGIVILSSSFNIFSKTVKSEAATAFSICSTLCVSLAVWNVQKGVFDTAELLLRTMTDTMTAVVPTMEAMFISSGNITSAAVTSAGVNTMIALSETLFSRFLYPAAVVCWLLAVCSAVTENSGITFMSKAVKSTVSGVLITVMALCGFVMALQVETAQSADSFTQRTLRYAVGSYVPIVGGSVSESFSVIASSLSVIRKTCGAAGIIALIVIFIFPFASLILNRAAVGIAGALAGMISCERERVLLSEAGSVCTFMIAVCAAGAVMFTVALGIFCRTPAAMG